MVSFGVAAKKKEKKEVSNTTTFKLHTIQCPTKVQSKSFNQIKSGLPNNMAVSQLMTLKLYGTPLLPNLNHV